MLIKQYCIWFQKAEGSVGVIFPVDILDNFLYPAESVRNLGVWFDSQFTFTKHVQNVCKGCFAQLRDFRWARRYLTTGTSVLVTNAIVSSRLDNCNSFTGASQSPTYITHSVYRTVLLELSLILVNSPVISPVLNSLHWLPVD